MNKYFFILTAILMLLIFTPLILAIPTVNNYVNDYAGVLSSNEISLLTKDIAGIKSNYSVEIAIVIVNGTEGMERIMYANKIGEQSGVGSAETDNGVVILWSTGAEKGGAIATGRGIESVLNDAKTARIGRDSRLYMDKGQYFEGFSYILNQVENEFKADNSKFTVNKDKVSYKGYEANTSVAATILVILIIIIIILIATGNGGLLLFFIPGSNSKGKFGGGSFGGGGGKF